MNTLETEINQKLAEMNLKIKNLKYRKKKNAEKKTLEQRMAVLSDEEKVAIENGLHDLDRSLYGFLSPCCYG